MTTDLKSTVTVVRTPEEEAAEERRRRRYLREKRAHEDRVYRRLRRERSHKEEEERRIHTPRRNRVRGPSTQPSKPFPEGRPVSYPPGVVGGIVRQARNRSLDKLQRAFTRWRKDRHCLAFNAASADRTVSFISLLDDFSKANPDVPFEQAADSAICLTILFSSLWGEVESQKGAGEGSLSIPQRMVRFIETTYNNNNRC